MGDAVETGGESVEDLTERQVVEKYGAYVGRIVDRVWDGGPCHGLSREDLRSYGYRGLLEAYRSYDSARETAFSTFAYMRIRGAMLDGVRDFRRAPRGRKTRERDNVGPTRANETSRALRSSCEKVTLSRDAASNSAGAAICTYLMAPSDMEQLELGERPSQRTGLEREEAMGRVREALDELSTVERTVVQLYFVEERTTVEIAKELDASKGWISRLKDRAVRELRDRVRGRDRPEEDQLAEVVDFPGRASDAESAA